MTPELFRECCALLWGAQWHAGAALALSVDPRTLRRWAAGSAPVPPGVALALANELDGHAVKAAALAATIRGAVHGNP